MPKKIDISNRDRVIGDIRLSKVIRKQHFIIEWDTVMQDMMFGCISMICVRYLANKKSSFRVYNQSLLSAITYDKIRDRKDKDIFIWLQNVHKFNKIEITDAQTDACREEFINMIEETDYPVLLEMSPLLTIVEAIQGLYKDELMSSIEIILSEYEWFFVDYMVERLKSLFPKKSNINITINHCNDDTLGYILELSKKQSLDNYVLCIHNDELLVRAFNNDENLRGLTFIVPKLGYSDIDEQMIAFFNARDKYNEYIIYVPITITPLSEK